MNKTILVFPSFLVILSLYSFVCGDLYKAVYAILSAIYFEISLARLTK